MSSSNNFIADAEESGDSILVMGGGLIILVLSGD